MNFKIVFMALLVVFATSFVSIASSFSISAPKICEGANSETYYVKYDANSGEVQPAGDGTGGGIPR